MESVLGILGGGARLCQRMGHSVAQRCDLRSCTLFRVACKNMSRWVSSMIFNKKISKKKCLGNVERF